VFPPPSRPTRGGREEGFSIPAQREANTRKAASLGAAVIAEFIYAGESGTKVDQRTGLQEMLGYIRDHAVDYCIVHKLDRLARSRAGRRCHPLRPQAGRGHPRLH
jgi:site-specific DNA recombinase